MNKELINAATGLSEILLSRKLTLTSAESCTSGWIGAALAAVKNSSEFYSCGFITYTYAAKHRVLGVKNATLEKYSAVSEAAIGEMATGAKSLSGVDVSLATSGYAGPSGGEDGTPAGTVWLGWCLPDGTTCAQEYHFSGDSEQVMQQASLAAINELTRLLTERLQQD